MNVKSGSEKKSFEPTVYVGDLSSKTLESDLFRIFSSVGEVRTISIIRRQDPLPSFAFVTFVKKEDATRAAKEYNHYELHRKQIRVSVAYDPSDPKLAESNLFVKNLPANFTASDLFQNFSIFGTILSCKVATHSDGTSKGFGFVQFDKKKAAKLAIKNCKGIMIDDKEVQVEIYNPDLKKSVEEVKKADPVFTNCFIKNFPSDTTEESLREMLEKYGKVNSVFFPKKEDGATKGFAFANFENPLDATNAISSLHDQFLFGKTNPINGLAVEPFYIQKAQKKAEREEELRKSIEKLSMDGQNYKRNLYVTNIPDSFAKEDLMEIFCEFGSVVSLSVNRDAIHTGKNYAYVCFFSPEEASLAVERGNEIFLDGNKLHISYFKNKNERKLEKTFSFKPSTSFVYNRKFNSGKPYDPLLSELSESENHSNSGEEFVYKAVLARAEAYKKIWPRLNVSDAEQFSKKITRAILDKSEHDILSMANFNILLNKGISACINEGESSSNELEAEKR